MNNQNDQDLYTIPPNFIGTSTFWGGLFKVRNVIEAGILAVAVGVPVVMFLPFNLTVRIIIFCLTALPLAMLALIGIDGECLSSFLVILLRYLRKRRVITADSSKSKRIPSLKAEKDPNTLNHITSYIPVEKIEDPVSQEVFLHHWDASHCAGYHQLHLSYLQLRQSALGRTQLNHRPPHNLLLSKIHQTVHPQLVQMHVFCFSCCIILVSFVLFVIYARFWSISFSSAKLLDSFQKSPTS